MAIIKGENMENVRISTFKDEIAASIDPKDKKQNVAAIIEKAARHLEGLPQDHIDILVKEQTNLYTK